MNNKIEQLAQYIKEAKEIVIFTGAGISTESGISDYRSKGGIWSRFQPVTIQEFLASEEKRKLYWQRKHELYASMRDAKPNAGHLAITELEKMGKLKGIITQNIDGLHHLSGSSANSILEIHGTNRQTICLSCGDLRPWQEAYEKLQRGIEVPLCDLCAGLLKPNTISFGQNLNTEVLNQSIAWANACDLILAIGSTLIVEPAASIPKIAKVNGAQLVIITMSETPLDSVADLKFSNSAGEILTETMLELNKIMKK